MDYWNYVLLDPCDSIVDPLLNKGAFQDIVEVRGSSSFRRQPDLRGTRREREHFASLHHSGRLVNLGVDRGIYHSIRR